MQHRRIAADQSIRLDITETKQKGGPLEALLADKEALTNVLLYHVVAGRFSAAEVVKSGSLDMVNGGSTSITTSTCNKVFINDSQITATDITADNGIIHVIDTVIIPN